MPGKKHTHKYRKIDVAGTQCWACAFPDCSHYMPDHLKALIPGRMSICWNCGESFILDARALLMDMPVCIDCAAGISNDVLDELIGIENKL